MSLFPATLAVLPEWLNKLSFPVWMEKITADPLGLFCYGLLLLVLFGWYFATEHERRKRDVGSVLLVLVTLLCLIALLPLERKLKGAIDIVGGSSFTMKVQPRDDEEGNKVAVTEEDTDNAITIIEKRLNESGVAEPVIFRQGVNRFVVQMPGVKPEDSESIRKKLQEAAKLELREVHPQSDMLADQVASGEHIEPGYKVFQYVYKVEEGTPQEKELSRNILLNRRPAVQGNNIVRATPDPMGGGRVDITLNGEGEDKMIALTAPMTAGRDRIAIVLDGKCISAPTMQSDKPLGKQFQITGLNAEGEAVSLAKNLMNPINNPLEIDEERTVSPTLGAAVVKQGVMSGLLGLAATFVFILLYYRFAGLVALIGLVVNTVMLFGIMAMFGFAFSLPGIAGIVLTIGMAVDANVLIYERLREEIAAGKSVKNALALAYEKAFTAIFDSNFTSLITAIVLFWRASGTVKGFAITLTIGLVASMFASILVTRVLFRWCVDKNMIKTFKFANLVKATNFDFLGKSGVAAMVSFGLIIASLGVYVVKKEKSLGIDFTGGTIITYNLGTNQEVPFTEVENVIKGLSLKKAAVPQEEQNLVTGRLLTVRCDKEDASLLEESLVKAFPALEANGKPSREEVSALLGEEFLRDSGLALLMGMVLIFLYVALRYRMAFAVGATIALFHDVIICCGMIVILGNQLSLIHIAAILTIAGYSINDTVIIFDRIREQLRYSTGSLKDIMNEAINATLSRTVLTSGATLFSVAALYLFGGQAMRDFSLMILIGIVVGTYSSIFVASALVLWWAKINNADYRETEESKAETVEVVG